MHNVSILNATSWHPSSANPLHYAPDASKAPQPTGLTQAEIRRIILDLIG